MLGAFVALIIVLLLVLGGWYASRNCSKPTMRGKLLCKYWDKAA